MIVSLAIDLAMFYGMTELAMFQKNHGDIGWYRFSLGFSYYVAANIFLDLYKIKFAI